MPDDRLHFAPTAEDIAHAERTLALHRFFNGRSVADLLSDMAWFVQFIAYRHSVESKTIDITDPDARS